MFILVDLLKVSALALLSGIAGTGLGGFAGILIPGSGRRLLSVVLEFSAGLMLAVVCFELLPEAFVQGGMTNTFLGVLSGIIVIILIDDIIRRLDIFKPDKSSSFKKNSKRIPAKNGTGVRKWDADLLRTGFLMVIGIALHNFPEGFAVGSGFEASHSLGVLLTLVIAIHDVPEGIAMAFPMKAGGFSGAKVLMLSVLSGIPMGFGAFLGALLGNVSSKFIAACLGFAGGAMLYIVSGEIIPESKRLYSGRLPSIGNVLGILCGIFVSMVA